MSSQEEKTPKSDIEKAADSISAGIAFAGAFVMVGLVACGMLASIPSSSSMDGIWVKHGIEQLGEDVKDGFEIQGCLASGRKWTGYSCSDEISDALKAALDQQRLVDRVYKDAVK